MRNELETAARRLARGHLLADDDAFISAISLALQTLGQNARREDAIAEATAIRVRQAKAEAADAINAARVEGAKAERQRIQAILTAKEAEGREEVARSSRSAASCRWRLPSPD